MRGVRKRTAASGRDHSEDAAGPASEPVIEPAAVGAARPVIEPGVEFAAEPITGVEHAAVPVTTAEPTGLLARLRTPPGGRDARTMLVAFLVDRAGTGIWSAASVLYFTFVVHLGARQIGLLLGVGGAVGIAGSPLAGRLMGRFQLRAVLIACHLIRFGTVCLLLACHSFAALLPVVAVLCVTDRVAKTLEVLFASRVAGERRATYRALSRVAMNAGWALGAGVSAIGLAVGTRTAYTALVLANAASFLVAALLVFRTREHAQPGGVPQAQTPDTVAAPTSPTSPPPARTTPWRDPRYLLFVLLDTPMNLDDAVLTVALPLWLVTRTTAPHALVPAFLIINTLMVVFLQLPVSARVEGPRRAAQAVVAFGLTMLGGSVLVALSTSGGRVTASALLLGAAVLVTLAELMRSVSSWELAISLAPPQARAQPRAQASYLGVAGMSLSVARSGGPVLLTNAVMLAGPAGWLVFGASVSGLAFVQRRLAIRRLDVLAAI